MALDLSLGADVLGIQGMIAGMIGIIFLGVIVILLKGFALYKAARLQEKVWFWVLLVVNTAGILELVYLYMRRKK